MNVDGFNVIAPDREKHREALAAISSRMTERHVDWETSRIGLIDNAIVTNWGVFEITLRIGTARVKAAGVDCVETRSEYRKLGLMRKTALSSLEAMRQNVYDVSILLGIEHFYGRFGYVSGWPQYEFYVEVDHLPSQPLDFELCEFTEHRGDLAEIYNRQNATLTGTAVRPTYRGFKWPGMHQGYLWLDGRGEALGYVIGDFKGRDQNNKCVEILDAVGDPEQILGVLAGLARKWSFERVYFLRLPFNSLMAQYLRSANCRILAKHKKQGGHMIRIVNLQTLFEKLAGELALRLGKSYLANWNGDLLISCNDEEIMLSIDGPNVRVAPTGQTEHSIRGGSDIVRLIIGSESPSETTTFSNMALSGDAMRLAEVLFPKQYPQISGADL